MRSFMKWLKDRPEFIRILLVLLAGLNFFYAERTFSTYPLVALAHVMVAIVLLVGAILIR